MLLLNKNNVEYNIKCEEYKKFQNDADVLNKVELSDLQNQVVSEINKVGFLDFSAHLILGATGSGKTEVYLESAQKIVDDTLLCAVTSLRPFHTNPHIFRQLQTVRYCHLQAQT